MQLLEHHAKDCSVSFDFSSDAITEIDSFFRREHKVIIPLTVKEILEQNIAKKLA